MKHGPGTNLENLDFEAVDKKLRRTRRPKLFRLLVRILLRLTRVATTHLWLNQASLSKTPYIYIYIFFFLVPYMFLGFCTNNIFMLGMFWCFRTICISLYVICLLVFSSFVSIVDALSSSLWGLGEPLFKYSFRPYGDLEEKCSFRPCGDLEAFCFKYSLRPYVDLEDFC